MFLFFLISSCIFSRKLSKGKNGETTTWESTTTTTFRPETAETILFSTSHMLTSSSSTQFLTPRIIYPITEPKTTRKSFTTHTYPQDPSENFQFISAANESDLDEIIELKCEKGGDMDVFFGELENECIFTIYCCGANVNPAKNIYFMPKSYGLK